MFRVKLAKIRRKPEIKEIKEKVQLSIIHKKKLSIREILPMNYIKLI